jgi:hypothetical protein
MREPDLPEILDLFPGLIGTAWEKTSEPDEQYNCLAWAFGAHDAWWQAERVLVHWAFVETNPMTPHRVSGDKARLPRPPSLSSLHPVRARERTQRG